MPTYGEPPFPIIEGTSACEAVKILSLKHNYPLVNINVLDVLSVVFEYMDNDRHTSTDPWYQKQATYPPQQAFLEFKYAMDVVQRHDAGHPKPPRKVWNFFRTDQVIKDRAERIFMANLRTSSAVESRAKIISQLHQEAQTNPRGLKQYEKNKLRKTRDAMRKS